MNKEIERIKLLEIDNGVYQNLCKYQETYGEKWDINSIIKAFLIVYERENYRLRNLRIKRLRNVKRKSSYDQETEQIELTIKIKLTEGTHEMLEAYNHIISKDKDLFLEKGGVISYLMLPYTQKKFAKVYDKVMNAHNKEVRYSKRLNRGKI